MSEIKGLEIIPLARLKKETQYQIRVKSELKDQNSVFFDTPWEFKTDWYTINFIFYGIFFRVSRIPIDR